MSSMIRCIATAGHFVHWSDPYFWIAAAASAFYPLFCNISALCEYRTRVLTRLFGGNPYHACYALAVVVGFVGCCRDYIYKSAMDLQPQAACMDELLIQATATLLFTLGTALLFSSFWALGLTATFFGNCFGIVMDHRVTTFPYNVSDHPMYYGIVMMGLGTATWSKSPVGIVLTLVGYVANRIVVRFEGPFTTAIFAQRRQGMCS